MSEHTKELDSKEIAKRPKYVPRRKSGTIITERKQTEMLCKYLSGASIQKLKSQYQCSKTTVLRIIALHKTGKENRLVVEEDYLPSLEVIEEEKAKIRDSWTKEQELDRRVTKSCPIVFCDFKVSDYYRNGQGRLYQ